MTNVIPLPFQGDLIDYLKLNGHSFDWLWRDGEAFVAVRPICEAMGIAWQAQHRKLTSPESPVNCRVMMTVGSDGKQREMVCMAFLDVMFWITNIHPSKVGPEAREAFRRTREEIKLVLAAHYHDRLLGESREAVTQLQAFISDYIAMRPVRGKIVRAFEAGWTWQIMVQNCPSYTQKRLIEETKGLVRIGAIPEALPGTPLVGADARQLSLFAEG